MLVIIILVFMITCVNILGERIKIQTLGINQDFIISKFLSMLMTSIILTMITEDKQHHFHIRQQVDTLLMLA